MECLDLMNRQITVAKTLIDDKKTGGPVWDTPKNHAQRSVPVPSFLCDLLAEVVAGKGPEDLVFTSARGKPMSNGNFRHYVFEPAAADAGLSGLTVHEPRANTGGPRGTRTHNLRRDGSTSFTAGDASCQASTRRIRPGDLRPVWKAP